MTTEASNVGMAIITFLLMGAIAVKFEAIVNFLAEIIPFRFGRRN